MKKGSWASHVCPSVHMVARFGHGTSLDETWEGDL